jgi:rRNA-processing protein FCF1
MKKAKVIFDTNFLLEKRLKNFFGKQDQLIKFASVSDIIIPQLVLSELTNRYRGYFEEQKKTFLSQLLVNVISHDIDSCDINQRIEALKTNESIEYQVIDLTDFSILQEMRDLALNKNAPFKGKDKDSDSGFKDAYIYFTVKEYLTTIEDETVFFVTDDTLLTKAFANVQRVKVIKDFEEFKQASGLTFLDDYFIQKLQTEVDERITTDSIFDFWENINGNRVLQIQLEENVIIVETDSREIVCYINKNEYDIENLVNSGSFASTHNAVDYLDQFKQFFSDDEIVEILEASIDNSQIIPDYDVQQFISDIYLNKKFLLTPHYQAEIERIFLERPAPSDELPF